MKTRTRQVGGYLLVWKHPEGLELDALGDEFDVFEVRTDPEGQDHWSVCPDGAPNGFYRALFAEVEE